MKAVQVHQFGGPEVMKVENVPLPSCGHNQVLVKVMAAGVNPVDTYVRNGLYGGPKEFPYTPGMDFAGLVEAIGPSVTKFKVGDRVFGMRVDFAGAYAQYCVVDAKACYHLAGHLSFSQGSAVPVPYFTAYRGLFQKCDAKPGETVLVHGASGAVGLAAIQLAKARGLTVFGTAGTPEGIKLVTENGADLALNYKDPAYIETIMASTGGRGVDVIIENVANVNLGKDLTLIKQHGRIVVIGSRGEVQVNPGLILVKEPMITGLALTTALEADFQEIEAAVVDGLNRKTLNPIIDKEYHLEKAAQAHIDIMSGAGAHGKLVLTVSH